MRIQTKEQSVVFGFRPLSLWERVRERAYCGPFSRTLVRLQTRGKTLFGSVGPLPRPFSQGEKGELNRKRYAQLMVTLLIAVALKYFYSTASVNQLRWILAPVTLAVELISGRQFAFEANAGYIDSNHTFVIAASCAGVNFLITSFLMLTLGKLWRDRSRNIKWRFLPVAAAVAYVATLVANTVRITTAMQLRGMTVAGSLTAGQLHRLEGIFVYFGFLLLLYVLSERASERQLVAVDANHSSNRGDWRAILNRSLFPLLIYYGTTLGLPILNGAFRQSDFWEHSLFVLATPLIFVIPFGLAQKLIENIMRPNTGSAGALARIERAARTRTCAPFFLRLPRTAHACADEGVRPPRVKSPHSTLIEFLGKAIPFAGFVFVRGIWQHPLTFLNRVRIPTVGGPH